MKNRIALTCLITLSYCSQVVYGQNRQIDSVAGELAEKYDHVHVLPPLIIVNNGGKMDCTPRKNETQARAESANRYCTFKKGETGVYYYGYDSLFTSVPAGKYKSIVLTAENGSVDVLNSSSLKNIPENFSSDDLYGYIIVKNGKQYAARYFEGREFLSNVKAFPEIDPRLLRDEHYWNLRAKHDHVFKISPLYITNTGGKQFCQPLPVTEKTEIVMYEDLENGEWVEETVSVPALSEMCFFKKGKTAVYFADDTLSNVVPEGEYDELYIPLTAGRINITADRRDYDFSRDSVPFDILADEFGELNFADLITSKEGLYTVYNMDGGAMIDRAKGIAPRNWSEFIVYKDDSLTLDEFSSSYPVTDSYDGIVPEAFPFPVLAQSDIEMWKYEKELRGDYFDEFYGTFPVKYTWRHKICDDYDYECPFTYLYNKGGKLAVVEDTLYQPFSDFDAYGETVEKIDTIYTRTTTVQGGDFGTLSNRGNVIMSGLTDVSVWGSIYNSKGEETWINAPAGSRAYERTDYAPASNVRFISYKKDDEYTLLELADESEPLKTQSPVKIIRKVPKYGQPRYFCLIQKEGKWGLIDCNDGFLAVDHLYDDPDEVPLISVPDWQKPMVKSLREQLNADLIIWDGGNGDGVLKARNKETRKWGMFQAFDAESIEEIIPMQYDSLKFFSFNGTVTAVYNNGKVGFYLSKFSYGEEAEESVPCIYDEYQRFSAKKRDAYGGYRSALYMGVKRDGMWGWVDWETGEEKSEFKYETKDELPGPWW